MAYSLLSMFDPSTSEGTSMKWVSMGVIFLVVTPQLWVVSSGMLRLVIYLSKFVMNLSSQLFYKPKQVTLVVSGLFLLIVLSNQVGMIPYVFTSTSHLSVNLSVALPLWLGGLLYMMRNSFKSLMAHLVPVGCPTLLIPLLVMIEFTSLMIRPMSLGVRLMSNMMAGHMVMALLGGGVSLLLKNSIVYFPVTAIQAGLIGFEVCVGVVQAYVFMNLMMMYWKENVVKPS